MTHRAASKWIAAGILGLSLAILPAAGTAWAQGTAGTGTAGTGTAGGGAETRDDDGFDYGWLGLIGLAGLAGLLRRDNHRRAGDVTTR